MQTTVKRHSRGVSRGLLDCEVFIIVGANGLVLGYHILFIDSAVFSLYPAGPRCSLAYVGKLSGNAVYIPFFSIVNSFPPFYPLVWQTDKTYAL